MKINIIYDDTMALSDRINQIIGKNYYGDIIYKKNTLYNELKEIVENTKVDFDIYRIYDQSDILNSHLEELNNSIVLYIHSNFAIINKEEFQIFIKKLPYVKENYKLISNDENFGYIFVNCFNDYNYQINNKAFNDNLIKEDINVTSVVNISKYNNLIKYITSGFDTRYFNSIQGDDFIITKKSSNINKIKKEYTYYHLLPDNMKSWMVLPFNYQETNEYASYDMERLPMADIAIRWIHKAVSVKEFKDILNKTFRFLEMRSQKKVSKKDYKELTDNLFIDKVKKRFDEFKKTDKYSCIANLISNNTEYASIDDIYIKYYELYKKINKKYKDQCNELVIGHGDLFFANMLYDNEIGLIRFIDPKGALKEDDLWTNRYYDVAKLSHSICGNYDFINSGLYEIKIDKDLHLNLQIFNDNKIYVDVFKEYLNKYGFKYELVRLYELSLFLSMVPLHIDNNNKVLAFILNSINIIKEIEKNV